MGDDDGDNVITTTLVDGGLGDDDLTENGVIVDQGGPENPSVTGRGVPAFPTLYIGIAAAIGAGVLAYLISRRLRHQEQLDLQSASTGVEKNVHPYFYLIIVAYK